MFFENHSMIEVKKSEHNVEDCAYQQMNEDQDKENLMLLIMVFFVMLWMSLRMSPLKATTYFFLLDVSGNNA